MATLNQYLAGPLILALQGRFEPFCEICFPTSFSSKELSLINIEL
jgi:hypothetical protein